MRPIRSLSPNLGFTLIELMVVLMLISLFSALVVPSVVSATRHETVSTQGDKLAELFRFAYLSAITRHGPVKVHVDERRGLCTATVSNTALPWIEEQQDKPAEAIATLKMPESIRMEVKRTGEDERSSPFETGGAITFYGDGRADGVVVTLTDGGGEVYVVEVIGATGEVIVRREEA